MAAGFGLSVLTVLLVPVIGWGALPLLVGRGDLHVGDDTSDGLLSIRTDTGYLFICDRLGCGYTRFQVTLGVLCCDALCLFCHALFELYGFLLLRLGHALGGSLTGKRLRIPELEKNRHSAVELKVTRRDARERHVTISSVDSEFVHYLMKMTEQLNSVRAFDNL